MHKESSNKHEAIKCDAGKDYPDLSRNASGPGVKLNMERVKLDSIVLYTSKGEKISKAAFEFINDPGSRLALTKLYKYGSSQASLPPYIFSYDATPLPAYNSGMVDHWGFYNGRNFFNEHPVTYVYGRSDVQPYIINKVLDSDQNELMGYICI